MDWISVNDRLPEDDATYLVYGRNGYGIVFALYYGDGEWLTWDDLTNITRFVTHWMLLPEPPKEDLSMKKYSINEFFAGNVDIRCKNAEQKMAVLKECDKRGVVWNDDEKATYHIPECSVFEIGFYMNGKLTQSNGHDGRNVVDFDKIDFDPREPSYQILIDCDGTTTTANMTINGKGIKTAIARRNPEDKFNWRKGAELAFERLWNSPRKAEKRPEVREVKRWAKPGEYIKIVSAQSANNENYCNGDILRVTSYYVGVRNGWVNAKGASVIIVPEEYVVLEGYRP